MAFSFTWWMERRSLGRLGAAVKALALIDP